MRSIAEHIISALHQEFPALPHFEELLSASFEAHPVPFGTRAYGERFLESARDPQWLAECLVLNSEKEGVGAEQLWAIAAATTDAQVATQIHRHACDESRHASMYLAALRLVFPNAADTEELRALREELCPLPPSGPSLTSAQAPEQGGGWPGQRSTLAGAAEIERALDELVQMNIGEIRTRINQLLLQRALGAWCAEADRPRLAKLLDTLVRDETRHIGYTGQLLDRACAAGFRDVVGDLMHERLQNFNELTRKEVGEAVFDGF